MNKISGVIFYFNQTQQQLNKMQLNPLHKNFWVKKSARRGVQKLTPIHAPTVSAYKLLHPLRLDICAKYAYARLHNQFEDLEWAEEVYKQHILAMNGGYEHKPRKTNIQDFFCHFHSILASLKNDGYTASQESIPVHSYDPHLIVDGAHRVAGCLYNNIDPPVRVSKKQDYIPCYSYAWFNARGLKTEITDFILMEYLRLRPDLFVSIVWPKATEFVDVINQILVEHCVVVCQKSIKLPSKKALSNVVRQIYFSESWMENSTDKAKNTHGKANGCWDDNGVCHIFVLQADSLEKINTAKQHCRVACGIKKEVLHITDTRIEALRVAGIFFNANSVELINKATLNESAEFANRIIQYCNAVGLGDGYVIHGSAVMEACGIRHADDLDYISVNGNPLKVDKSISLDNEKATYTGHSLAELAYDPRNYFYYCGAKFVKLDIVREMKKIRGEPKDQSDLELIDGFGSNQKAKRT